MSPVTVVDTITAVDCGQWDDLAGDTALATYGWLRTVEECLTIDLTPVYFLLTENQSLRAATVCYRSFRADHIFTLDHMIFGRLRDTAAELSVTFLPALVCSPWAAYGQHFLLGSEDDPETRLRLVATLIDAIEEVASRERLSLCMTNVLRPEFEIFSETGRRHYTSTSLPSLCYLDICYNSFDEYVAHLRSFSRNRARSVQKEQRRCERFGVTIEKLTEPGAIQDTLHQLADRHWSRHNGSGFHFRPSLFSKVKEYLGDAARIYIAKSDTRVIGFSMVLQKGGVAYGLEVGVEEDQGREGAVYFNLCFYQPIKDAIAEGLRRIYFGRGVPQVKLRRGCQVQDVFLFYRATSQVRTHLLRPWFQVHETWTRHKVRKLERMVMG